MASVWEQIERAAEAGDYELVADLCLPLEEAERERLAEPARALAERLYEGRWTRPVPRAGQTARFALGPPLPSEGYENFEPPANRLEALVRSRPREWRDAWARWAVRRGHRDKFLTWATLRTLILDGACTKPAGVGYTRLMLVALRDLEYSRETARTRGGAIELPPSQPDAASALRADPDALKEDVWAPFALMPYEGWPDWERALVELANEGAVSRDRVIDETLAALDRNTDAGAVKRWMAFHDRTLAPTPRELAPRQGTYLRWLESDRDARIGFALMHLLRLDRQLPLDERALLDRLDAAVALRAKTHAKRATTLVGRVLDRSPALADEGGELLAGALSHPAAEVQEAALAILERHPRALSAERLAGFGDAVDPALRGRLAQLAGVAVTVPPPSIVDPEPPPAPTAIAPIEDVEDLLELASLLIEGHDDPDDYERFVDGISRLCGAPVPEGRRTALLRRAAKRRDHVKSYAEQLTCQWLDPRDAFRFGWNGTSPALRVRLTELGERLARSEPDVLLSAPTHRGGLIDPDVLAGRLERARAVRDHDLAQALLRLPAAGLGRIAEAGGEPGAVARAALTGEPPPDGARLPASWDTARVLADPDSVTPAPPDDWFHHPAPQLTLSPVRWLAAWESQSDFTAADSYVAQRWLALVWPGRREFHFQCVERALWAWREDGVDRKAVGLRAALETMRYPGEPLGPAALALAARALVSAEAVRLLATDVVIDAIAERRLQPALLGQALAQADRWPDAVMDRLAASLQPVADRGPDELQHVLEAMLGALGDRKPRIPALLDLLRRLAQSAGTAVADPAAREWLASLSPGSKSGQLARAALDVSGGA